MGKRRKRELYPEIKRDYRTYGVKCTLGRENGSCSLIYTGYINGAYSNSNLTRILDYFVKNLRELPDTVSLSLENKITEMDDSYSLFLAAVNAVHQQREDALSKLKQLRILKI